MEGESTRTESCRRCGHDQPHGEDYCLHCGLPLYARPTGWHPRTWWRWWRWFLLNKILHVQDTPHRIALGLAVGMFVALTPTFGFQMLITVALCWILRANKVVGIPLAWITNPVTMGPIYYFNYWIGGLFLGPGQVGLSHFQKLGQFQGAGAGWWADTVAGIRYAWGLILDVFWQCWLGSLLVAAVCGAITYALGYWGVQAYRRHHRRRFPASQFGAGGAMPPATRGEE